MIILRFDGGLGNQMYHYTVYKLLQKNFPEHEIIIDITSYQEGVSHNGYELEKIFPKINIRKATSKELVGITYYPVVRYQGIYGKLYRKGFYWLKKRKLIAPPKNYLRESEWDVFLEKAVLQPEQRYYIECRWNYSYHYYEGFRTELLDDFEFCDDRLEEQIENILLEPETVSVHVRAGDYIGSDFDILRMDYYRQAISYMRKELSNPYFIIVSDDESYARNMLSFIQEDNVVYIKTHQRQEAYKDMLILSRCKHNIIANSTFSYWAAEINSNQNKIVIAPGRYSKVHSEFIVPEKWVKISV